MDDRLHIFLLGTPQVEWKSFPYDVPRTQVRALLYRLAADVSPASRDHLCWLFWPDEMQCVARRRLTHLSSHLRSALPIPELLISTTDHISLNQDLVCSDVVAFGHLLESPKYMDNYLTTLGLYRGSFLDGFALENALVFDEWMYLQRRRCEQRFLAALETFIKYFSEIHEYNAAIACCQAYLEINALAEDIHRRLIELYVIIGNKLAAQRQYDYCVDLLQRELSEAPLPETIAALNPIVQIKVSASTPDTVNQSTNTAFDTPLVGRACELNTLHALYRQAGDGRGSICIVSGESGIGKSRLLSEFLASVPGLVVQGYCYPATQKIPYYPILDNSSWRENLCVDRNDINIGLLANLYCNGAYSSLQDVLETAEKQNQVDSALTQIFLNHASDQPVILCLEDLQWVDTATLSWLELIGLRLQNKRILVLGSYCCAATEHLVDWQRRLSHMQVHLNEIILKGLSKQIAGDLLAAMNCSGNRFPRVVVDDLWETTAGNPLYLLEIGSMLSTEGWTVDNVRKLKDILPESLRHAIDLRLSDLTTHARQAIEAAAVLSAPFDFDELLYVTGQTESQIADALEELMDRYLLERHAPHYHFRHMLIRTRVKKSMKPMRWELLLRRVQRLEGISVTNVRARAT